MSPLLFLRATEEPNFLLALRFSKVLLQKPNSKMKFSRKNRITSNLDPRSRLSSYANEEYTVAWICPQAVELAAARGMMDQIHGLPQRAPKPADENVYTLGTMGDQKVVMTSLPLHECGSVSAARVAQNMLFTFPNIHFGLLVGVGGGIPTEETNPMQDVRLGDVVIGSSPDSGDVVVYDVGKHLADGTFENTFIPSRPPRPLGSAVLAMRSQYLRTGSKIEPYIKQMLERYPEMRSQGFNHPGAAGDLLFQPEYHHRGNRPTCFQCDVSQTVHREPRSGTSPAIHYGTIASGNTIMKDPARRQAIKQKFNAKCIEMEAAGVINVIPCVVIRGISNYADSHKNDLWAPYAAATAAACAKELLCYI